MLVDAAGLGQFADGDGAGWIDAALVDPILDALEVDGGPFEGEARRALEVDCLVRGIVFGIGIGIGIWE